MSILAKLQNTSWRNVIAPSITIAVLAFGIAALFTLNTVIPAIYLALVFLVLLAIYLGGIHHHVVALIHR